MSWKSRTNSGLFVAASNAPLKDIATADYICYGAADEVQIQAAINALPAAGGRVELSVGTFTISSTINMASATKRIDLTGNGPNTIIQNLNTSGGHAISATNTAGSPGVRYGVRISDLQVKGVSGSGDGIHLDYVDCPYISDVIAYENGACGISIQNDAFSGSEGDAHVLGCYSLHNVSHGVYFNYVHECNVCGTHIEGNGGCGIYIGAACYDPSINGCNIEDNTGSAVYILDGSSVQIVGNTLEGNGDGTLTIAGSTSGRICIVGNNIESSTRGIYFANTAVIEDVVVADNTFALSTAASAKFVKINGLSVSGNTVHYISTLEAGGFYFETCNEVSVSGNSIDSYGDALSIYATNNMIVSGNILTSLYVGVAPNLRANARLDACTYIKMSDNSFNRRGATPLSQNITLNASTSVELFNNTFRGATAVLDSTTGIIDAKNNYGYIFPGEIRTVGGSIATLTENAFNSIDNPFGQSVRLISLDIYVSTAATATSPNIDCGIGSGATTDYTTLFDDLPGETIGFYRSTIATPGTQTVPQLWASGSGDRYLNMSIKGAAATGMVATYVATVMGL